MLSPAKRSQWSTTASDIQLRRQRQHLKPYLYDLGILPDKMQADPHRIAHPHFQALAKSWGLTRDPEFSRKYALERDLGEFLVQHSAVIDEMTSAGQLRAKRLAAKRLAAEKAEVKGPTSDAWKTTMPSYTTGDLFASRGEYDGAILYMSRVAARSSVGPDDDATLGEASQESALEAALSAIDGGTSLDAVGSSVISMISGGDGGDMGDDKDVSLIQLSTSSDVDLKRNCAGALLRLSHKPNFQDKIVAAGAVMALANMNATPDAGIKSDCAEALCNLVVGVRNPHVLNPIAIGVVMEGCSDVGNPQLQSLCLASVLKLLSCRPADPKLDHHTVFLENGLMGVLRELSTAIMDMDDTVVDLYGSVIVKLASRNLNHPALVSDGLIAVASQLLDTNDAELRAPILMDGEAGGDASEFGGLMSGMDLPLAGDAPAAAADDDTSAFIAASAAANAVEEDIPDDTLPAENAMDLVEGCCSQDRGALVINSLLSTGEFLYPLMDAKLHTRIIDLAKTKSHAVNNALTTLTSFALYPESRAAIVHAGAMAPLVAKIRASGKADGKVLAMRVVRQLCVDPACQPALVGKGAVPALISISMMGERFLEEDSAVALCSLILNETAEPAPPPGAPPPKKKKNILELGALGALNSLAKSDVVDLQIKAASTLADLAADPLVASKLVDAGGLDTLVKLAARQNSLTLQYVAVALGNLSAGSKRLQRRLISNGVVRMVCGIVGQIEGAEYPETHLEGKKNAARDEKLGAVTMELQESLRRSCAAALGNLSYVSDLHIQFLTAGALQALVTLGGNPSSGTHTRISVATGLCNVSAQNTTRKKMIQLGCVPILVGLGRSNPLEASKQDCARALCNLSCEVGEEVTIARQGAAGGLVMMALFRSDSGVTKELCASALYNLLCDPVSRVALMREEVVWSFTKLVCSEFASPDLRRVTARMMCALSCIGNARPVLLEQRTVPAIAHMISAVGSDMSGSYVRRTCAMTLRNLSSDAPEPFKLVKEGLVSAVIELCTAAESAVVYQTAAVVANMSTSPPCCQFLAENDSVAVLLQLCSSERPAVMRFATTILCNLSHLDTHQKQLMQERVVAVLILCSDTKDYNQIRQASQAFYNFSCSVDPEVRAGIIKSGASRALGSLVNGCLHAKDDIAAMKAASGGKMKYSPALPNEREITLALLVGGIANLCVIAETRRRFSEAHIPQLLVRVIEQSRKANVILFALNAMCDLTSNRGDLTRFLSAGAMPALVDLAKMGVEGAPMNSSQRRRPVIAAADDPITTVLTLRRVILRILMNLSHEVESRMRQTADGLLEAAVLLAGIEVDKDLGKKGKADEDAAAAAAFAAAAAGAGGDDDDDGDDAKSAEVEDSDDGDDESVSGDAGVPPDVKEEMVEAAVRIFWNVSRAGANATNAALFREGAVAALLAVCDHPVARLQNVAVVALNNLSNDAPRRKRLAEMGVVGVLTKVVTNTRSNHTKDKATFALRNITSDGGEDASEDLVATGGVDMLVRLMMVGGDEDAEVPDGDGRRGKRDDPKTDTFVASALLPSVPAFLEGVMPGVGAGEDLRSEGAGAAADTDDILSPWISVYKLPERAADEPYVPAVEVEYEEARKPEDDESDFSDADDEAEEVIPGDYPGPAQLDAVKDKFLWSRLGGGASAETGLAAVRHMKEEQASKAALAAAVDPLANALQTAPQKDTSDVEESSDEDGAHRGSWAPPEPGTATLPLSALPAKTGPGGVLRSGLPGGPPLKPVARSPTSGNVSPVGVKPRTPGSKKTTARLSPLKR